MRTQSNSRFGAGGPRRQRPRMVVGLMALLLILSACGGDGGEGEQPQPVTEAEDDITATDPGNDAESPDDSTIDELVAAAQDEGNVMWYTSHIEANAQAAAEAFTAEYGIDVEILRLPTGELTARYASEAEAGAVLADVVQTSSPTFAAEGAEAGWFTELDETQIPELSGWPAEQVQSHSVSLFTIPYGIAYNSDMIAGDPPEEWDDLLADEYRNDIFFTDPAANTSYLAPVSFWFDELGSEFLEQFAQQETTLVPSAFGALQQMAAGERAILVFGFPGAADELIEQGAPLAFTFPSPTTGVEHIAKISTEATNPNAARLLVNFLLSSEGQPDLLEGVGAPFVGNPEGSVALPEGYASVDYELAEERRSELLGILGIPE